MGVQETYNEIVEEVQSKEAFSELLPESDNSEKLLKDVSTKSKVDPWRSMAWVFASVIEDIKTLFELFKKETKKIARENRIGTVEWWLQSVSEFQFGDSIQVIDGKPLYAVENPEKRIVTNVSHQVASGINIIKAVKGVFPDFVPLSESERSALDFYLRRIAPPGIKFGLISRDAEQIKIVGDLFYQGLNDLAEIQSKVEAAIDSYIKLLPANGENVVFNGSFVLNELIDQVREIEGVNDFRVNEIEVTRESISFDPGRSYQPVSGYLRIADGQPLSQTINYFTSNV